MKRNDVVAWARDTLDRARRGALAEDGLVEFKSDVPDPARAARRIAGHANAARGENILWLLGVSETGEVCGIRAFDFDSWWRQVEAVFDEISPEPVDVIVSDGDSEFLAVSLSTHDAPYVVKNQRNAAGGEGIEREVPWRRSSGTRTARRSDLVSILVPQSRLPSVAVHKCSLRVWNGPPQGPRDALADMDLYVVPRGREPVSIPNHGASVALRSATGADLAMLASVTIDSLTQPKGENERLRSVLESRPVYATTTGVVFNGPGMVKLRAMGRIERWTEEAQQTLALRLALVPDLGEVAARMDVLVDRAQSADANSAMWIMPPE